MCVGRTLQSRGRLLVIDRPLVMGILNVTPDSFYDGGRYEDTDAAVERAAGMLSEGADIIDVGGASSRPGSVPPLPDEEISRTVPVIRQLRKRFPDAWISIDTYRAAVAEAALEAGADIVNDISSGDDDPKMWDVVGRRKAPYIMMHKQGTPATMQKQPQYADVVRDIVEYFIEKTAAARDAGIKDIVIDPGFGFGKTIAHNYALLRRLEAFGIFPFPLLVGLSRKSMIWKVAGVSPAGALPGTIAAEAVALRKGAHILRVHDVAATRQLVAVMQRYGPGWSAGWDDA